MIGYGCHPWQRNPLEIHSRILELVVRLSQTPNGTGGWVGVDPRHGHRPAALHAQPAARLYRHGADGRAVRRAGVS